MSNPKILTYSGENRVGAIATSPDPFQELRHISVCL